MRSILFGLLLLISSPAFAGDNLPELGSGIADAGENPIESFDLNIFQRAKHPPSKPGSRIIIHSDTPGIGGDINFKWKIFGLTPCFTYNNVKDSHAGRLTATGPCIRKDDIFVLGDFMIGAGVVRADLKYGMPDFNTTLRKVALVPWGSGFYKMTKHSSIGLKIIPAEAKATEGALIYQYLF